MSRARFAGLVLAALPALGCHRGPATVWSAPLEVRLSAAADSTHVTLMARPGAKISARLKPALETPEGVVYRFDAESRTPDSAYFGAPPVAAIPGRHTRLRGTLRASVCDAGERVCHAVVVQL